MKIKRKQLFYFGAFLIAVSFLIAQTPPQKPQGGTTTKKPETKKKPDKKDTVADETEKYWHNPDYRPYDKSFDALNTLSDSYAKNKLRLAISYYQSGRSVIQKMRDEVERLRKESAEKLRFDEKWYWQEMDRKRREEHSISQKKKEAKMDAVTSFTKAINHLDSIQNVKVRESAEYKELQASLYRDWVLQQYDLGNLPQCIPLLERYIDLDPKYEEEISPHKYLSSCYAFKEKVLEKYSAGSEQQRVFYKTKKNEHLLRATEIKYGKNTPEYEYMLDLVNRDEVMAISPP